MSISNYQPWPHFSYEDFKPTSHLLHMLMQALGKLKLLNPYEPQWSHVGLWITSQGVSTGLIPYKDAGFSVSVNLITHEVVIRTTWNQFSTFPLHSMAVADLIAKLFSNLNKVGIELMINSKPQEVPEPILFEADTGKSLYEDRIVNAWWRILVSSQRVMQQYHARFLGKTPPITLMWGTLDLRDVRFNCKPVTPSGVNSGYLRRNAMDEEQIEAGWWAGNDMYPRAAYYSFTYPQPPAIEQSAIKPASGYWNKELSEFILDYEEVRASRNPDQCLLEFLESTYEQGARLAKWEPRFIGPGKPR